MRALFGLLASLAVGLITHVVFAKGQPREAGLTIFDVDSAQREFKGAEPNLEGAGARVTTSVRTVEESLDGVRLPQSAWDALSIKPGDLLYITDPRWWWGGLRLDPHHVDRRDDDSCLLGRFSLLQRPAPCDRITVHG